MSSSRRPFCLLHAGVFSTCMALQAKHFKLMCMALRVTACLIPVSHPSSPRSPATSIARMCLSRIDASSPRCACPGSTRPRRNVPVPDRRVRAEMCLSLVDASSPRCACPRSTRSAVNASSPKCACPRSTRPRPNVPVPDRSRMHIWTPSIVSQQSEVRRPRTRLCEMNSPSRPTNAPPHLAIFTPARALSLRNSYVIT